MGRKGQALKVPLSEAAGIRGSQSSSFIWCKARGQRISVDVCIVKQVRRPKKCFGCEHRR